MPVVVAVLGSKTFVNANAALVLEYPKVVPHASKTKVLVPVFLETSVVPVNIPVLPAYEVN